MSLDNNYSRLDRIVGRYLAHQVLEERRTWGMACAQDILLYCNDQEIVVPSRRPLLWMNIRIADLIHHGANGFDLEEVNGFGPGINFKWCFDDKTIR